MDEFIFAALARVAEAHDHALRKREACMIASPGDALYDDIFNDLHDHAATCKTLRLLVSSHVSTCDRGLLSRMPLRAPRLRRLHMRARVAGVGRTRLLAWLTVLVPSGVLHVNADATVGPACRGAR